MTMTPFKSRLKDLAALVLQHLDDSGLAGYSAKAGRVVWTGRAERFQLVTDGRTPEEYADNLAGQLFEIFGAGVTINGAPPEFGQVLKGQAEIKGALQSLVNKMIGKPIEYTDPRGRLIAGLFERPAGGYLLSGAAGMDEANADLKSACQMLVNGISDYLKEVGDGYFNKNTALNFYSRHNKPEAPAVARHNPKTDMTVDQFNAIHGEPRLSLNFEKYSGMYHLWNGGALVATDADLPAALQNLVNYIWLNWHVAKKD